MPERWRQIGYRTEMLIATGPYRIESKLGSGSIREVFRATDARLRRTVAVKILPRDKTPDPNANAGPCGRRERLRPSIVEHHRGTRPANDGGTDFLMMEYVPGKPLDRLTTSKGLPPAEAMGTGSGPHCAGRGSRSGHYIGISSQQM